MTINSTNRRAGPFVGNGVQTEFPFTFKIFVPEDTLVVRSDPATQTEVELVIPGDYNAALNPDQDAAPGGTVTLTAPLPVGMELVILSDVPELQQVNVINGGGFFPAIFTMVIDKLTILIQQLHERLGRTLQVDIATDDDVELTLPVRPDGVLTWDSTGTVLLAKLPEELGLPPTPTAADLNKVMVVRDQGIGPVWVADFLNFAELSGQITTAQIGDAQVTTPKLADGAVTSAKIADGTIQAGDLAPGAVSGALGYTPVDKAGDTMTGALTVPTLTTGAGGAYFQGGSFVAGDQAMFFRTPAGSITDPAATRWALSCPGPAFDLRFNRYTAAGAFVDVPIYFGFADGKAYIPNGIISGEITANGIIRTQGAGAGVSVSPRSGTGNDWIVYSNTGADLQFYWTGGGDRMTLNGPSGSLVVSGYKLAFAGGSLGFNSDGSSFTDIVTSPTNAIRNYWAPSKDWRFLVDGVQKASVNSDGSLAFEGNAFAKGAYFLSAPADGAARWSLARGGGDRLDFNAYTDAGAYLATPMYITRATQRVAFTAGMDFFYPSTLNNQVENIYVDGIIRWRWGIAAGTADMALSAYDASGNVNFRPFAIGLGNGQIVIGATGGVGGPMRAFFPGNETGAWLSNQIAINLIGNGPGIMFNAAGGAGKVSLGQYGSDNSLMITKADGSASRFIFDGNSAIGYAVGGWQTGSDSRLKSGVSVLTAGLDILAGLTPKRFKIAGSVEDAGLGLGRFTSGLIAQDLIGGPLDELIGLPLPNPYLPGQEGYDAYVDLYSFDYTGLWGYAIAAFQEVKTRLVAAEGTIATLTAALAALDARVTALENPGP